MTKVGVVSAASKFGPWAGAGAAVLLAVVQLIGGTGQLKQQVLNNTQQIEKLDNKKADQREMDDVKHMLERLDKKIDKLSDKLDRRK